MRQLLRRDAGAVVAERDRDRLGVGRDRDLDDLALAPVLGGIVENVQKHLPQALRVAGDEGDLALGGAVSQLQMILAQQLPVGEDRVLQLGLDVQQLDVQLEAPVLDARKLQQLLHETGQPRGLLLDDLDAAAGVVFDRGVKHQRLAPAGDGGQRRAQLVGDGGDKLRLHLLRAADLLRQGVDGLGELREIRLFRQRQLGSVASGGDVARGLRHLADGLCDLVAKPDRAQQRREQRHGESDEHDQRGIDGFKHQTDHDAGHDRRRRENALRERHARIQPAKPAAQMPQQLTVVHGISSPTCSRSPRRS